MRKKILVIGVAVPILMFSTLFGLFVGFAYFKSSPTLYRATSTIEVAIPRTVCTVSREMDVVPGTTMFKQILNTRLILLRSREVIDIAAKHFKEEYRDTGISDEEIYLMLYSAVTLAPRDNTALIDITSTHTKPEVAQGLANAYAIAAEFYAAKRNNPSFDDTIPPVGSTVLVNQAPLPQSPVSPKASVVLPVASAVGFIIGCVMATILAACVFRYDKTR